MLKSRLTLKNYLFTVFIVFVANPCCSHPCQNRGVCMSVGFDQYKCDCTRTGFYGENCTTRKFVVECPHLEWDIYSYHFTELCHNVSRSFLFALITAEFLTRIKLLLKPTPNTVHYILTHFKGVWNIVNNISFLRNMIMRYVLTCKYKSLSRVLSRLKEKCTLQILDF